jgi:hypothetical protein
MKKHIQRARKGGVMLALGLSVAVLSGCEGLMDVDLPAQLTDDVLTDPGNAAILVNTFITHFEFGWNSQAYQNFGREAGGEVHLCGPCGVSDFQTSSPSFVAHSKSIRFSRDLYEKLNTEWTVQRVPQRARYMALASLYQGAVLASFGSHLCEVTLDGGELQTAAATLDQAEAMLTRAITEITAAGDFPVQNNIASSARTFAHGLRAQTRFMKGDMTGAAADAALVPTNFFAYATREPGVQRRNNAWYEGQSGAYMELYDPVSSEKCVADGLCAAGWWQSPLPNPATGQTWGDYIPFTGWTNLGILADGRAVSDAGIPIRTAAGPSPWNNRIGVTAGAVPDTRVRGTIASITGKGGNGMLPNRYTDEGSDYPIVSWKEMVLIRAAAAGGQTAIDLVNQIRAADNLPTVTYLTGASSPAQIRYMVLEEVRRATFYEGRYVYWMLKNPDVSWFPRGAGATRFKKRRLEGGVRWTMSTGNNNNEYIDNPNISLADRGTGCGNVEKPVNL